MKHCQEKYFWTSYSNYKKIANTDFQYHREDVYKIYQYILMKGVYIDSWSFKLPDYCPFWPYF